MTETLPFDNFLKLTFPMFCYLSTRFSRNGPPFLLREQLESSPLIQSAFLTAQVVQLAFCRLILILSDLSNLVLILLTSLTKRKMIWSSGGGGTFGLLRFDRLSRFPKHLSVSFICPLHINSLTHLNTVRICNMIL